MPHSNAESWTHRARRALGRVLDGSTLAVVADQLSGLTPDGATVNHVTGRAYIVNSVSNNVTVIEGTRFR